MSGPEGNGMSHVGPLPRLWGMTARLDYASLLGDLLPHLLQIEAALAKSSLGRDLVTLVKLRASQINGCGYCVHMHTGEALRSGEAIERIALTAAWQETSVFSPAERAALAWTDAVTRLGPEGPSDALFRALQEHFSPAEIARLTLAIGMINLWNRLGVALRTEHPRQPLTRLKKPETSLAQNP